MHFFVISKHYNNETIHLVLSKSFKQRIIINKQLDQHKFTHILYNTSAFNLILTKREPF